VAWAESLALADAALYQAKADGRNRAVCALSDQPFAEAELAPVGSLAAEGRVELLTVTGVAPDAPAAASGEAATAAVATTPPTRDTATA
jgi:hypothetical protein